MRVWLWVLLAVLALIQTVSCRKKSKFINNCKGKYVCEKIRGSKCKCIDRNKLCDGENDCPGTDDEMHCDCPPLSNPDHGRVDLTQGQKAGAIAKFYCDGGYMIVGTNTRTCQAGGLWSDTSPTCMKGCDCDDKKTVSEIRMPVNGSADVLTLNQFQTIVASMTWMAVYDLVSVSPVKVPHLYSWIGQFNGPNAQGNYDADFMTDFARGNATCQRFVAEYKPLNSQFAIFDINENDNAGVDFEISLSSCPDEYLWRFVCTDFSALQTGRCPRDETYLQLIVKESDLKTSMDDLPWASIERDLMQNTENTVMGFCRQSGMESHFLLLGDCTIIPTPQEEPNPGSP